MYDQNAVKIYTDGSAKPNPGKGGIGIVAEFPDSMNLDNFELSEGYVQSTNNRMELRACIRALLWLQAELKVRTLTRAIVITDSKYVHENHTNVQYWKDNGWRTTEGKPYKNADLWDTFLKERQKIKTRVDFVRENGKTRPVLSRVDTLAKQGADNPTRTDYGFQPGKFTAPRTANKKGATSYVPDGKEIIIRIYRKSIYGKNATEIYKITFDIYDELEDKYIQKSVAYQGEECIPLKRNNCYRVKFNDSSTFPKIIEAELVEYIKGKK